MSSQPLGAASPILDAIMKIRQLGSRGLNAIEHPLDTLGLTPQAQQQQGHQQAIEQMNAEHNAHRNDAANQSFQKPDLATMKKPLGK